MAWELSEDECYGVWISVNTILKVRFGIEDDEDWQLRHDTWWSMRRFEFDGKSAEEVVWSDPDKVVRLALESSHPRIVTRPSRPRHQGWTEPK